MTGVHGLRVREKADGDFTLRVASGTVFGRDRAMDQWRSETAWEQVMFELHHQLAADCWYLGDFPLSALLLARDANYPWFILVPRVADIEEIYQLDGEQRRALLDESCLLAELLQRELSADKLNIAALGNMVPQLHLHHIVRMRDDAAWPGPVWGVAAARAYSDDALAALRARLAAALPASQFSWR